MTTGSISGQNGKDPEIHWMLNVEQEFVEFFGGEKPNPDWSYTDNDSGKKHRWAFKKDG